MNAVISRDHAKAEGRSRYFTGEPCRHGHLCERFVASRSCVECQRAIQDRKRRESPQMGYERTNLWRKKNAQHIAEYRERTKDAEYARRAALRRADPEKYRDMARRYRAENKELCAQRVKLAVQKKAETYRERARQWHKKNPGRSNAIVRAYRGAKLHRTPAWADLKAIAAVYDLAAERGLTVDHIVPLQGELVCGLHVENNLQLLTGRANSAKGNKFDPVAFSMGPEPHESVAARIRSASSVVKVFV